MVDWTNLTTEELLHLITDDPEVESLILIHLITNIKGQRELGGRCYKCEIIAKKFRITVTQDEITKLEALRVIRWLLHDLGFSDDSLNKAMELYDKYKDRRP